MSENPLESTSTPQGETKESPLVHLDEMCPIDELLTPENAQDAQRMTNMGWVSVFRQSPAKNMEAEMLIGRITATAVKEGRWVDIPLQGAHEKLVESGLVEVTNNEGGEQVIRPNERLVSFVKERLAPFGPKERSSE